MRVFNLKYCNPKSLDKWQITMIGYIIFLLIQTPSFLLCKGLDKKPLDWILIQFLIQILGIQSNCCKEIN